MSEDILADPSSIPYNDTINDVLTPWEPILKQLLDAPDTVDADKVPAKAWLEETVKNKKRSINKELVPYVGSLSLTIRAQISNWVDVKIGQDKKKQRQWLRCLLIAHAYTVPFRSIRQALLRVTHLPKFWFRHFGQATVTLHKKFGR